MPTENSPALAEALLFASAYISLASGDDDREDNDVKALESVMDIVSQTSLAERQDLRTAAKRLIREESNPLLTGQYRAFLEDLDEQFPEDNNAVTEFDFPHQRSIPDFDDPIWDHLEGGYGTPYNPVPPLRRLQTAYTAEEQSEIYQELWNELHHQGDVGPCSYACVPQLVKIARSNPPLTHDLFGLIAVIEIQRHEKQNPPLSDFAAGYLDALAAIPSLFANVPASQWDESLIGSACAAIAASKGNRILALAYLDFTEERAVAFLREETGFDP